MVAPDHPGFGGSDEFAEVEAMDDLVYHYLDVLDRIGLDRPHVVGASFGGWIAAELAVAAPHRVGALVLLAPAGLRLPGHPVADLFLMSPEDERRRRRIKRHSHARGCCEGPRPVAAGPEMAALGRFYRDAAAASPVALPSSPVIANASLPLS